MVQAGAKTTPPMGEFSWACQLNKYRLLRGRNNVRNNTGHAISSPFIKEDAEAASKTESAGSSLVSPNLFLLDLNDPCPFFHHMVQVHSRINPASLNWQPPSKWTIQFPHSPSIHHYLIQSPPPNDQRPRPYSLPKPRNAFKGTHQYSNQATQNTSHPHISTCKHYVNNLVFAFLLSTANLKHLPRSVALRPAASSHNPLISPPKNAAKIPSNNQKRYRRDK